MLQQNIRRGRKKATTGIGEDKRSWKTEDPTEEVKEGHQNLSHYKDVIGLSSNEVHIRWECSVHCNT